MKTMKIKWNERQLNIIKNGYLLQKLMIERAELDKKILELSEQIWGKETPQENYEDYE